MVLYIYIHPVNNGSEVANGRRNYRWW